MGTDINCFLQIRKNKNHAWRALKQIEIMRNYELFGVINNVRDSSFPSIAEGFTLDAMGLANDKMGIEIIEDQVRLLFDDDHDFEDDEPQWLGYHDFCIMTADMMMKWKYWNELNCYTRKILGDLLIELLAYGRNNARYIIGFDS